MNKILSLYPPKALGLHGLDSEKYANNERKRLLKKRRKKERKK